MAILALSAQDYQVLRQQAEETYPQECCGLLLGVLQGDCHQVLTVWPTVNAWSAAVEAELAALAFPEKGVGDSHSDSPTPFSGERLWGEGHDRRDRFWIEPQVLLQAQQLARVRGWLVLGVYHSHPDQEAVPSERDRVMAWPTYFYLIMSVVAGQMLDLQVWQLDEAGNFEPQAVEFGVG